MPKSIFISYVYEDKKHRDLLKDWCSRKLLGDGLEVTFERGDYRSKGEAAIRSEILSMIQGSAVVLFLIGQKTHNHPWVTYEAECALSKNKKIVLTRIPLTTESIPKTLKNYQTIPFEANAIRAAL